MIRPRALVVRGEPVVIVERDPGIEDQCLLPGHTVLPAVAVKNERSTIQRGVRQISVLPMIEIRRALAEVFAGGADVGMISKIERVKPSRHVVPSDNDRMVRCK